MHVVSQNSSNITASESTDDDSEFNQIRVLQIVKKIIYGVKFIWISIGNLDPTIIFVILEWLLLVYWSRSISLVFLRGSPLDRRNSYRDLGGCQGLQGGPFQQRPYHGFL